MESKHSQTPAHSLSLTSTKEKDETHRRNYWQLFVILNADASKLRMEFWDPRERFTPIHEVNDNNIHPELLRLKNIRRGMQTNLSCNEILALLNEIKTLMHEEQNLDIVFSHANSRRDGHRGHLMYSYCWGLLSASKGFTHHNDSVEELIALARERKEEIDKPFYTSINKISSRWKDINLTQQKSNILNDFKKFYENCETKPFTRSKIIEMWAIQYAQDNNGENPFYTLRQQRRSGCLSIFNPSVTNSIILFNKFLTGENISNNLRIIMLANEQIMPKDQATAIDITATCFNISS